MFDKQRFVLHPCATCRSPVLAIRDLGTATIDLHGGGADLIFPHHECERAQSEAATGKQFSKHWMHQAMVRMEGEKMSKSLGNLVFISDLRKEFDPNAIRLGLLNFHYRDSWEWNDEIMTSAISRLERWKKSGEGNGALNSVRDHLDNDLDTPTALEVIDDAVRKGQGVSNAALLLGVDITSA